MDQGGRPSSHQEKVKVQRNTAARSAGQGIGTYIGRDTRCVSAYMQVPWVRGGAACTCIAGTATVLSAKGRGQLKALSIFKHDARVDHLSSPRHIHTVPPPLAKD
ncbi:uncharacterized protein TRIREDRAFT_111593 [Trichoderma reesei QM6a]|uniref:Predicted protein n=1 Tax=Hypocrea jecorina (strain QM6a) TaxID=431241 RepID=G0RUY4_HYPJQ|nr:uncharacterized protein TRIREDRAFT_111593 [Trichoderma reesei QM6a]EGR44891.1 predicted protein [Trichoderma reesei QM6a]